MSYANTIKYIIHFLLGTDISEEIVDLVGYTSDANKYAQYKIVIHPSGFFDNEMYGTAQSLPQLPLLQLNGMPVLFGTDKPEKRIGNTIIIDADLVASTYFLVSRYEEYIRRDIRDVHGRFIGRESLPFRAGFIDRPIVDEYRIFLRKMLRSVNINVPEISQEISRIFLTHDLDAPTLYTTWKGFVRSLLNRRGIINSLKSKFGNVEEDQYYTFPWLFAQDEAVSKAFGKERCEKILFVRAGGRTVYDKPFYRLTDSLIRKIINNSVSNNYTIGLHVSYAAGANPELIHGEAENLRRHTQLAIHWNRNHYLDNREPEDMEFLAKSGITDDFTIGYADIVGFRLGTCFPVRYINPATLQVSDIMTLHPLTIMDCTLSAERYMHLDYEHAMQLCLHMAEQVNKVGGELVLLWHNNEVSISPDSYQRQLYSEYFEQITHKYS